MESITSINGREYRVVRESTSNKHASASVHGSMVRIRIPFSWPREKGFRAFIDLKKRILRKLEKKPAAFTKSTPITFTDGQEVVVMGKRFILKKTAGRGEKTSSAKLDGKTVVVRLSPNISQEQEGEVFSNLSRRVIASAIRPDLEARVRRLNCETFQGGLSKVFVKDAISNYGSCSTKGNVNLSFRILFAPEAVLDYVIVHELAHLKERNHSAAFWALVETAMPEYAEHKCWLKQNGMKLGKTGALEAPLVVK